jgi:hypothetical protein
MDVPSFLRLPLRGGSVFSFDCFRLVFKGRGLLLLLPILLLLQLLLLLL